MGGFKEGGAPPPSSGTPEKVGGKRGKRTLLSGNFSFDKKIDKLTRTAC